MRRCHSKYENLIANIQWEAVDCSLAWHLDDCFSKIGVYEANGLILSISDITVEDTIVFRR